MTSAKLIILGLGAAIRLKTALLQSLATRPSAEWSDHLATFIAGVEACELRDTTALVVLLADLSEQIRALTGSRDAATDPAPRMPASSSKAEILAQFRLEVAESLVQAGRRRVTVSPTVERLIDFIDEHYAQRLTLPVLADSVGRSKRHVATVFRQETGEAIHHYLTRVRVHHAAALIRQGEKIEAVSLLVGYRSKKDFYRHFKQQIGVNPAVYKTALSIFASLSKPRRP